MCNLSFSDCSAFVLGNGPTLPDAEALARLDGQFTIGVNRILQRYTPTVVAWCDAEMRDDERPRFSTTDAILVCTYRKPIEGAQRLYSVKLKRTQEASERLDCFFASGSSATAAARMAIAAGFGRIHLLGMGAAKLGDNTNFYGVNPRHSRGTLQNFERENDTLLRQYPDRVVRSDDPDEWQLSAGRPQSEWRDLFAKMLEKAGAERIQC